LIDAQQLRQLVLREGVMLSRLPDTGEVFHTGGGY
jgi:hypothetical protein